MPTRDHMLGLAAHGLIEQLSQLSRRTPLRAAPDFFANTYPEMDEEAMRGNHDPRRPKPAKVRQSIDDFVRETLAREVKWLALDVAWPSDAESSFKAGDRVRPAGDWYKKHAGWNEAVITRVEGTSIWYLDPAKGAEVFDNAESLELIPAEAPAALEPGVYLTLAGHHRSFSRWDGEVWMSNAHAAHLANEQSCKSRIQDRAVIRKATEEELKA